MRQQDLRTAGRERCGGGLSHDGSLADALVQRHRLWSWLHAQVVCQEVPTAPVLGDRLTSPARNRQDAHGLPVSLLLPGLQFDGAAGKAEGLIVRGASLIVGGQRAKGQEHQPVELLPFEKEPFLKGRAVVHC
mgnify:CR=1 FL=1